MILAPTIIFVPVPVPTSAFVAGSSFPRITGHRPPQHGKTPPSWPPAHRQSPPSQDAQRALDNARRELAEQRARKLLA
jgi:hypothetical protein